jgi:hypothetical protein
MLALDGVYLHEGWTRPPRFIALPPPGNVDVERVVRCIRKRVINLLEKQDNENDELSEREPLLAACVAGSLTNRVATGTETGAATSVIRQAELIRPHNNEKSLRCANVDYFSLHANTRVGAGERKRLEKLCRYVARPPISNELLEELSDGRRPWCITSTSLKHPPFCDFFRQLCTTAASPMLLSDLIFCTQAQLLLFLIRRFSPLASAR